MADLIRIQYEPWDESLSKEKFTAFANDAAQRYGEAYALEVIRKFEEWLSPGKNSLTRVGGKEPIGASGKASKNFRVDSKKARGVTTIYVREAGLTPANQFIRKGIPPGVSVSLGALKLWAARKGINFLSSAEYKKKMGGKELKAGQQWTYGKAVKVSAYSSTSSKGNPFDVKEHGRSEKGKKNVVNSALKAIQNALYEEGTERPNSNWQKYYPAGQGRFDYPMYLVTGRKIIPEMNSRYSSSAADALVTYWNSSGRARVYDYKVGNLGGVRGVNPPSKGLF